MDEKKRPKEGLIAVIGDEDTVTGFLLAGIGQRDSRGTSNFLVCDQHTKRSKISKTFRSFCARLDISIILVTQDIAVEIRKEIAEHDEVIPTVLEIPSKSAKYDKSKDPIVRRVYTLLGKDLDEEMMKEKGRA
ncbi:hypothetical protein AAMO2058_000370500 [Amorphochlora amoebiformis]|uniref:V-type proton ATPase subunit F n=1 Tax=Amorphochlora amoebiformis TaxID=1561963 RepID=A0A7S0H288_9EUKA|mmetsp:Transcript_4329/g.6582  ORF Transcript_4329/g.6582 Transcript_4329/m.6582 type:complete len:133 (+) Transcript_4329:42-440(+)|eukprot:1392928-Amorphochlora_amoeboformis.AAC.1